jgi:hypothetical protein
MNRRYASFAVIFVILMLIVIQAVEVVDANPFVWPSTPNQEKPTLAIKTPQNNEVLNTKDTPYLNFTVNNPQSWYKVHSSMMTFELGLTTSVDVYIDGNLSNHFVDHHDYTNPAYDFTNFSVNLNQTSPGSHSANVTVYAYTLYLGPPMDKTHVLRENTTDGPLYEFPMVVSDTVNFSINKQIEPSPSIMPSLFTEPVSNSVALLAIASVIVIVAVASISLVYFKKQSQKLGGKA